MQIKRKVGASKRAILPRLVRLLFEFGELLVFENGSFSAANTIHFLKSFARREKGVRKRESEREKERERVRERDRVREREGVVRSVFSQTSCDIQNVDDGVSLDEDITKKHIQSLHIF